MWPGTLISRELDETNWYCVKFDSVAFVLEKLGLDFGFIYGQ